MKLKIGEIKYANCTPIYTSLKVHSDCAGFEFIEGEPAELNELLARGDIDVSSSSSIEYARHWDEYLVIPQISISSTGEVGSILFFSKGPIEDLGGARIAVSSASATSVVMLKALLRFRYGKEAFFSAVNPDLSLMLKEHDAALLIGDEALRAGKRAVAGTGLHVYDLGSLWQEYAGLPFVYALWMVRKDSAAQMPELCRRLKEGLKASREMAEGSFDSIALNAPESSWMGVEGLAAYWKAMSYRLGPEHQRGLMLFLELAERLGEAPLPPAVRFL
jgi:chorismate dehydratase